MIKNPVRSLLFGLTLLVAPLLAAAAPNEVVVLSRDFQQDQGPVGCVSLSGQDISDCRPDQRPYRVVRDQDRSFLRAIKESGIFGITIALKQPIVIGEGVAKVELRARVRRTKDHVIAMALTSRTQPEGQQGQAFNWCGPPTDSGMAVSGYELAGEANALTWRVEGLSRSHSERKAFLPDAKQEWHQWRVVFDRAAGTLALYTDGDPAPKLVQKGVDLDGIQLRSLWLGSAGASAPDAECYVDYDDLVVSYVPADKAP